MLALATPTVVVLAVLGVTFAAAVVVVLVLAGRLAEETKQLADETALMGRVRGPLAQIRDELRELTNGVGRLRDRGASS